MSFVLVLVVGSAVVGFVARSWLAILVPLLGVPLYVVGVNRGWWGCCGTGDAWQFGMVVLTIVGVAGAALGAGLGRMLIDGRRLRG